MNTNQILKKVSEMAPYNSSSGSMCIETLKDKLERIISLIQANHEEIQTILADYQPVLVTQYEIDHFLHTIKNIEKIEKHLTTYVGINIASFLPSNLPLYSLLLFAIIPSHVAEKVVVRPNSALVGLASIEKLFKILKIGEICPNITLFLGSRDEYLQKYISTSDFIIFTGRNETRELIKGSIKPGAYLINNGSGHNPILVTETANVDDAAEGVTHSKFFNAGQDCAGPDAVLVHQTVKEQFFEKLKKKVSKLKIGDHMDKETLVGKILGKDELPRFQNLINENMKDIVFGGEVDLENKIVYPTIIEKEITNGSLNFSELFGPVLFVYTYKNNDELKLYFEDFDGKYAQNKMYLSIFSEKLSPAITTKDYGIVLHNKIILNKEIDNSYTAYGGFSRGASSITENKKGKLNSVATPVFLPEVIRKIFVERRPLKDLVLPKRSFAPDRQKVHSIKKEVSLDFINGSRKIFGKNLAFAFIYGGVAQDKLDSPHAGIEVVVCLKENSEKMESEYVSFIEKLSIKCGLKPQNSVVSILKYSELVEQMYDLLHIVYGENSWTSPENRLDFSFLWGSAIKDQAAVHVFQHISILADDNKVGLTCEDKKAVKIIAADSKRILNQVQNVVVRKIEKEDVNEPNVSKNYSDWDRKEIAEALGEMSGHWDSKCTR